MTVRSQRLALGSFQINAGATATVYTVPSGHHTIIRSSLWNLTSATAVALDERISSGGVTVQMRKPNLVQNVVDVLEVWRVLEAGDIYAIRNPSAAQATVVVWLSGAELPLL